MYQNRHEQLPSSSDSVIGMLTYLPTPISYYTVLSACHHVLQGPANNVFNSCNLIRCVQAPKGYRHTVDDCSCTKKFFSLDTAICIFLFFIPVHLHDFDHLIIQITLNTFLKVMNPIETLAQTHRIEPLITHIAMQRCIKIFSKTN